MKDGLSSVKFFKEQLVSNRSLNMSVYDMDVIRGRNVTEEKATGLTEPE